MAFQLGHLCGGIAPGQQAAVNDGMQRLDPPVQQLRESGNIGYLPRRDTGLGQAAVCAARAD